MHATAFHQCVACKRFPPATAILATAFLSFAVLASYAYHYKTSQNKVISLQVEQLDRMNRTKDQLFSIVAHDLRSPVQNLKHTLVKLQTALADNDVNQALLLVNKMDSLLNSTCSLLNNLLYWAMSQTGQVHFARDNLQVNRLVEQVCYDYKYIATSRKIVVKNNVPGTLFCTGDLNTIKIVLRNLLDNAIKFSGDATEIVISGAEAGEECIIGVRDSGCGIDERVVQALFNSTGNRIDSSVTRSHSQSTGIGLWLAKTMTEKNGGRLHIRRSDPGTLINVHLPKYLIYEQTENTYRRRQPRRS